MKEEKSQSPSKKALQQEEDRWIDVHDDAVMIEMGVGLWRRPQAPRDESVWRKTPSERKALRKYRHIYKGQDMHFHSSPKKHIPVWGKLVIQLLRNKHFPNTTYSTQCWQSDIPEILGRYSIPNYKLKITESAVAKYTWNGRTYYPGELPFWKLQNRANAILSL